MSQHTIVVPDIGDYTDVPVIEILVKPGDEITKEQALLVLESDKATMEVPADQAGKVISVSVKIGDKVTKGSVIAQIELASVAPSVAVPPPATPATPAAPTASSKPPVSIPVPAGSYQGPVQHECEVS